MFLRNLPVLLLLAPGALLSIPALVARVFLKLYSVDPNLSGTHLVYGYTNALTLPYSNFISEARIVGSATLDLPAILSIASYLFFLFSLFTLFRKYNERSRRYEPKIQTRIKRSVSFTYRPLVGRSLNYTY